ncbi:hypothetical protein E4665_17845 [Sporolactobacillus shoreae]|uniref:Uncharacterized protein n=1 Tax=Sporolactobacillus shoreae TaxID=1465501 RepID=A0A4Z0GIR0_9BACL|nr:hypothetical protein [Sporolactobacillus shoreae]TGA95580.1 hypothetical protein E4665_17845 [Sporolactobacillus shoreae]
MHKNQLNYDKEWANENREHKRYLSKRSTAKSFIRKDATAEDLDDLEALIAERRKLITQK